MPYIFEMTMTSYRTFIYLFFFHFNNMFQVVLLKKCNQLHDFINLFVWFFWNNTQHRPISQTISRLETIIRTLHLTAYFAATMSKVMDIVNQSDALWDTHKWSIDLRTFCQRPDGTKSRPVHNVCTIVRHSNVTHVKLGSILYLQCEYFIGFKSEVVLPQYSHLVLHKTTLW